VKAYAKLNLALVVGPARSDGKHEVVTVLQHIDLCDDVTLEPAPALAVDGFGDDTIVRAALESVAAAAGVGPWWRARIEKRIPVAAGLGGGSSDAAAALRLANETLPGPLPGARLHELAAALGADVPFFLASGPQLGTGDGSTLEPVELAADFSVCLLLPHGAVKESTAAVYARFRAEVGFEERRAALHAALAAGELDRLPANDLASSPLAAELTARGAFRADVSGAGPILYGLFAARAPAERAARELEIFGKTWISKPVVVR
jgi:4-diphosphocytidyl-2-C-methyl-D-erythritol kinase